MILKILTGLLLKPIFIAVAVLSFATGSFFISEQSTGPLAQFIMLDGREAVLFGTALLAIGAACACFYLATWFFTLPLSVIGALLVVVGFGLQSADGFIPESVINGYIIQPVTGLVNAYAKPIIDQTIKPALELIDIFKP